MSTNIYITSVVNGRAGCTHSLRFRGQWLPEMGFTPGALVQAIPELGGMTFTLCNENIQSYSALNSNTLERNGKLLQVSYSGDWRNPCPILMTSGGILKSAGLDLGDQLITIYSPGFFRVRKLPPMTKVIHVIRVQYRPTTKPQARIQITGDFLTELGFMPESLVAVASSPGSISFTLHSNDDGIESYSELVRHARKNDLKLIHVRESPVNRKLKTNITITGFLVDKAGFIFDDAIIAACEPGFIKLQRLDAKALGF